MSAACGSVSRLLARRIACGVLVCSVGSVIPGRLLSAQGRATAILAGQVVDSTGAPVPGVEIAIPALSRIVLSDAAGNFLIRSLPPGTHDLRARKLGWRPSSEVVALAAGDSLERRVVLTRMTILEAVETRAVALRMREFEENRRLGLGKFVTREDIVRRKPAQTGQLLTVTNGIRVIRDQAGRAFVVTSRGRTSISGTPCGVNRHADVYVDNVPVYRWRPGEPPFDVNTIDPATIIGIEFYSGPSQAPVQYQNLNSLCGVLVIWTLR